MSASLFDNIVNGYGGFSNGYNIQSDTLPISKLKKWDEIFEYDKSRNEITKCQVIKPYYEYKGNGFIKISSSQCTYCLGDIRCMNTKDNQIVYNQSNGNYICADYNTLWNFIYLRFEENYRNCKRNFDLSEKELKSFIENNSKGVQENFFLKDTEKIKD